jgi:hypothetical protein
MHPVQLHGSFLNCMLPGAKLMAAVTVQLTAMLGFAPHQLRVLLAAACSAAA